MTSPITELDFDNIKSNIIEHFRSDPNSSFSDYNFEGSALNAIIDMLAYNTHTNAYYANMIHNESFIDTAQKRSSVVSIAKELGYTPISAKGSRAIVRITAVSNDNQTNSIVLERGGQFSSVNETGAHRFIVAETVTSIKTGANIILDNIVLIAGIFVSNVFTVNISQNVKSIFTIPNKKVDTSTIKVYVKETSSSIEKTEFFIVDNLYELTATSNSCFLQESYNGGYQIYFGGDVLGVQPVNGNVVIVEYIVADTEANGCRNFIYEESLGNQLTYGITLVEQAAAGSDNEDIDSIRHNAVKNNTAKKRAITVSDYQVLIKQNFPFIKSINVWGGENNVPPVYGKVFISLQPVNGFTMSDITKQSIIELLRKYSMLTIIPVLVDPNYLYIEFTTNIKFDKNKTSTSIASIRSNAYDTIAEFISSIMEFGKEYHESTLVSTLLRLDPGVISVDLRKKIGFNIIPRFSVLSLYEKTLYNKILPNSITSDTFDCIHESVAYQNVHLRDLTTETNSVGISDIGIYDVDNILIGIVGEVDLLSGRIKLILNITASEALQIRIRCKTVDSDITIINDQIIILNSATTNTSLASDNVVYVEQYGR